ncbi:hypothetical protein [Nocardiopsis tropica]|uniref:Uncharacterized protein n=1 Tax=Nocardiopsis tropica TaxID=109330 RepID=A0ABU7KR65_9ACTN|nr:hypothetical protein [Nocardiopsis umidischolae]MEE2051791.1 hypothetical protein [Nocardiopsis umidischolae]
MSTSDPRDPREELRDRLEAGALSTAAAGLALALDPEGDAAALRAAEEPGTLSAEESARIVASWGLGPDDIAAMARHLGVETSSAP